MVGVGIRHTDNQFLTKLNEKVHLVILKTSLSRQKNAPPVKIALLVP